MKAERTLEEIRTQGLAALRKRLGVAGMVRFLQQFEKGEGDYVKARKQWTAKVTMEEIRAAAGRKGKKRKAG